MMIMMNIEDEEGDDDDDNDDDDDDDDEEEDCLVPNYVSCHCETSIKWPLNHMVSRDWWPCITGIINMIL